MARQKAKLSNVKLDEISFVGKGDNPEAHIMLLKIKPEDELNKLKGEDDMKPEEIEALRKAKDDAEAKVADLIKSVEDVTKENETLKACAAEDKKKMDELEAAKLKKEDDSEDIYKGLPEGIVKKMKEDSATIAKMQDDGLTREYVSKAAEVTLVGKADVVGDLLKSIAKHSTVLANQVLDIFKTADARIKEGDLLKELGKKTDDTTTGDTAYDKIVNKAAELRKTHPELTEAKAFTKVYDEDHDLRAQYISERN